MHVGSRPSADYRCSLARNHECWNRATALRPLVHQQVSEAVIRELDTLLPNLSELLQQARLVLEDQDDHATKLSSLEAEKREVEATLHHYVEAIGDGEQVGVLGEKVRELEGRQSELVAEITHLTSHRALDAIPTLDEFRQQVVDLKDRLRAMDREVRADLVQIIREIRVIPQQQFDSTKVVLRARISFDLTRLLPWSVTSVLDAIDTDISFASFQRSIEVDLFDLRTHPDTQCLY